MALRTWPRPPRHLLVLFLGIMLLLASTLGWLGWRLIQQDRALADQEIRARLERTADLVAAELAGHLARIDGTLESLLTRPPATFPAAMDSAAAQLQDGALLVAIERGTVHTYPGHRLLYYPLLPAVGELPGTAFARGESLEFRDRNLEAAIREYGRLARSSEEATRAGGLLRLARVLRKAGRAEEALDAYDQLAKLHSAAVGGLPADLVARAARLPLLQQLGRLDALHDEALQFRSDLNRGQWRLTGASYQFYSGEAERWLPESERAASSPSPLALSLAEGVAAFWQLVERAPAEEQRAGLQTLSGLPEPVFLRWRGTGDRLVGLVASQTFLKAAWTRTLTGRLGESGIAFTLSDIEGNPILAPPERAAPHQVIRTAVDTGLPWTLHVMSVDPSSLLGDLAERRRLLLAGMLTAILLVVFGAYAVSRAVSRELDVARLQSEFVSAVSHEFRTPLTAMRQLAELLASGRIPSEGRRAEYYGVIKRETERLHRLVEGLLDFGRMEAGALEFHKEPVEVDDFVNRVIAEFRGESGDGHPLDVESTAMGKHVLADREALSRALWNLLDNAVKYSEAGAPIRVGVAANGAQIAITVSDRGVGMTAQERERIFEKFVRGSASRSLGVRGTGIGLAMVRHIVDAHGGQIAVESAPGQGSRFTILLPTMAP